MSRWRDEVLLDEHWKVRIVMRSAGVLHFASSSEPQLVEDSYDGTRSARWDPIGHPAYGDTLGFINWHDVAAVSWRKYEPPQP